MLAVGTSFLIREVPAVAAASAALGGTASATLFYNGGGPGVLLLGSGRAPAAMGSVAQVWLDLGQPVALLAAGMVTSAGLGRQVVVPTTAAVRGAVFFVQGAVLDSVDLVASVPGIWALR